MINHTSRPCIQLYQIIDNAFILEELGLLCADMGIDYDHLPGSEKRTKILDLLEYVARQNRQADLLHRLRELRPRMDWPATYHITRSGDVYAPPPLPERGTLPEPGRLPPGSRLLYSRNPLFTGRADDLHCLADTFLYDANRYDVIITQTAVAAGMGGIGKTQLATEFAHRYGRYFPGGVFWLSFAEAVTIPSEIAACGGPVGLNLIPGFANLPLPDQVQMVQRAWHEPVARLLIFDNCEEEKLLADWRPQHGGCHVLVTSRRQQWDPALGVSQLRLDVLPRKESVALLRQFVPDLTESEADAIAAELGDLPLALHLTGSFLVTYGRVVSPAAYLNQLRDKQILDHASMLGRGASHSPTSHDLNVARTFAVSYERLDSTNETDILAMMVLERIAFLAPGEPVPDDLRRSLALADEADEGDQLQLEDAWRRLIVLGFLDSENDGTVRLHRLLALFTRMKANDPVSVQRAAEKSVLTAVAQQVDEATYIFPIPLLLPHLYFVTDAAINREDEQSAFLCNLLGSWLNQSADFDSARFYWERDLNIREKVFGSSHPDIAGSLNNLGYCLKAAGKLTEALPCYERALTIRVQNYGPTHPDIAQSLNNLGGLLFAMGQLAEARIYLERALEIHKQVFGLTHPDTAFSLNNLGYLLQVMGQWPEAQSCYQRALDIWEQTVGRTHTATAKTLNNFGLLLIEMGQLTEAHLFVERAFEIFEQAFGSVHPLTATSMVNLGLILKGMGQFDEAQQYLERALAAYKKTLGHAHPDTARGINNLGNLLYSKGQLTEARACFELALTIREQALGPTHPDVAESLEVLARLTNDEGDGVKAGQLMRRVLAIYQNSHSAAYYDEPQKLVRPKFL